MKPQPIDRLYIGSGGTPVGWEGYPVTSTARQSWRCLGFTPIYVSPGNTPALAVPLGAWFVGYETYAGALMAAKRPNELPNEVGADSRFPVKEVKARDPIGAIQLYALENGPIDPWPKYATVWESGCPQEYEHKGGGLYLRAFEGK